MKPPFQPLTRRHFIRCSTALGLLAGLQHIVPAYAFENSGLKPKAPGDSDANEIDLLIREEQLQFGHRRGTAITINGTVPGPLVRLREGRDAILRVTNDLKEDSSIHWHGLLLPPGMDGVPGVSFAGIKAGETFTYRFPVRQNGTYWYHSHSAGQEQSGHYGPLIIDAAEPEPFQYDREHVVVLSDWTSENPMSLMAKLKRRQNYYNFQRRTVGTFFRDVAKDGFKPTVKDRLEWGRMRMDPSDISDVTGFTYSYLMNDSTAKSAPVMHGPDHHGSGNSAVPMETKIRLDEPGTGLENTGTRVLLCSDLRSLKPGEDSRPASREIELHITGNMERYMWGFDGKKYSDAKQPIQFYHGERVRLTLVNDTMMNHPIHLHGMFMELDNGAGPFKPKKHTVNVKPAERLSLDITADAIGNWAFHCHVLYHMEMGMFRVVSVVENKEGTAS